MAELPSVFISSTLEDLPEHRAAASRVVNKAGCHPDLPGDWPAQGSPPLETCLEQVDRADLVLVIAAHRYGWAPPDQKDGEQLMKMRSNKGSIRLHKA